MTFKEADIELKLLDKLEALKYSVRPDIRDKATLEANFRAKFEALNHCQLTDAEFARLRDDIITADVFQAAKRLREYGYFQREDGTPLHYMLVNLKDWCKNHFEVIHQLRINTDSSHHRYDVILLINGLPLVQIELKTLGITPRRAMEQIVEYKHDPGNGYANTLLCFMQLFIVSNRTNTYYFANNHPQHFAFNADERFLPIYQWAEEENRKITHLDDFAEAFLAKCSLARMLSRYMVLVASEQKLMIMRPYQIYAVQALIDCIHQDRGNGYNIDYFKPEGKTASAASAEALASAASSATAAEQGSAPSSTDTRADAGNLATAKAKPTRALSQRAVADAILDKHDAATDQRRFNALLATGSINDAITYYALFKERQAERASAAPTWRPLNIACVFSPPAEGNRDVKQLQEDLPQEKAVDTAIALFSGEDTNRSRQIWLVDPAPEVIKQLDAAVAQLETFLHADPGATLHPGGCQQPQGRHRPRRVHQPLQGGPAPQDSARPIHRPQRRATTADPAAPARGGPSWLLRHVP